MINIFSDGLKAATSALYQLRGCSITAQDGGAHNGGGAWGAEWTARKVPRETADILQSLEVSCLYIPP